MTLEPSHYEAVQRRRRIMEHYDPTGTDLAPGSVKLKTDDLVAFITGHLDAPGSQVDSILWDCDYFLTRDFSESLPPGGAQTVWEEEGRDLFRELLHYGQKLGIENLYDYRITNICRGAGGTFLDDLRPDELRSIHPDWVIRTWWWKGTWNLAVPELRDYKVDWLKRFLLHYEELDGIQIDFARHMPCLPPGRQWEDREHATAFIRSVREMMITLEQQRGRPLLLSVKVPETLAGCHEDGFDVETWAAESLVDIFTIGHRSNRVNIEEFRAITAGRAIKICPSFDGHHTMQGYIFPPMAYYRGLFANWWNQGADSVQIFNFLTQSPQDYQRLMATLKPDVAGSVPVFSRHFLPPAADLQHQALFEIGDPGILRFRDKIFVVGRRGGYHCAEGFLTRNRDLPLPVQLPNNGRAVSVPIQVSDPTANEVSRIESLGLILVFSGAVEGDVISILLNGTPLIMAERDADWKDAQIPAASAMPAEIVCANEMPEASPDQHLLCCRFEVSPGTLVPGENRITARVCERGKYFPGRHEYELRLEKAELHLTYRK